jgi:hypothetical protein
MMEAVRTSETSVDNHFTRQYNPEYSSEHHTLRRENLKSHIEISYRRSCFSYKTFTSIRLATQVMTKASSDLRQSIVQISPASGLTGQDALKRIHILLAYLTVLLNVKGAGVAQSV